HGEIARMQPRHVVPGHMRGDVFGLDLIERHGCGVDEPRVFATPGEHVARHDRPGVETHGAARQEIAPAHGDEVGRARTGADETPGHGRVSLRASAQVAGPTAVRGATSRPAGPAAARAAASAADGTPMSETTRSDRVMVRAPAASRSACGTSTSGTPRS